MYKVLIVECDPMVAMINEQYVKRNKNFEVVCKCRTVQETLIYIERNTVDLVLLEPRMHNTVGLEILREIRSREISVDVLIVTGLNDRCSLTEALRLGAVDYVIKPFTFERFKTALERYVIQSKALNEADTFSQKSIDRIIDMRTKKESACPKGIQEQTLSLITDCLNANTSQWLTGDEISSLIGLTGATVRRYMNYLLTTDSIVGEMDYETGGRPCMKYKIRKTPELSLC